MTPQRAINLLTAAIVTAFAMAIVVVPPPNLDLWWLMAVGRRMMETGAYIYQDPFTFTVAGSAWSPQAWLSALVYYGLHGAGGFAAIGLLRVALVGVTIALTFRSIAIAGIRTAIAAPLVMIAVFVAHTRFADRGQLFEYALLAGLLGFLLTSDKRGHRAFLVIPLVMQVAWVQLHASFLLGPAMVVLFFVSEAIARRLSFATRLYAGDLRRAAWLALALVAACVINPNPKAFLLQPFDRAHHELMSRFTLEWKSPFDAAIAGANFHPWFEVMLAAAALAVVLSLRRLPLSAIVLTAATLLLSLQSHRFRVEFVLVSAVTVCSMLRHAPPVQSLARRWKRREFAVAAVALAVSVALVVVERGRLRAGAPEAPLPDRALSFAIENDVARRPYHPVGFGSYLLWAAYGERPTFIDGRNFDAALYEDYLRGQTNAPALRGVIDKYDVDSFMIPAPASADAGMRNVHASLMTWHEKWDLVHMDDVAFVYVSRAAADSTWLAAHAYRHYHPLSFAGKPHSPEAFAAAVADMERLTTESPDFSPGWMDLGLARLSRGEAPGAMDAFEQVVRIDADNVLGWTQLGQAAGAAGQFETAEAAFGVVLRLAPGNAAGYVNRARARAAMGNILQAIQDCGRALEIDPGNAPAKELLDALQTRR
jgi:predicted TPR repeat methyltransferase